MALWAHSQDVAHLDGEFFATSGIADHAQIFLGNSDTAGDHHSVILPVASGTGRSI